MNLLTKFVLSIQLQNFQHRFQSAIKPTIDNSIGFGFVLKTGNQNIAASQIHIKRNARRHRRRRRQPPPNSPQSRNHYDFDRQNRMKIHHWAQNL